jgi:HlyD family secretion protein
VRTDHGLEPRLLRLGLANFDYAQVLDGVQEGEEVALLGLAEVQAKRQQDQSRIRERLGGGVPGAPSAGAAGGGRGSGGGR